MNPEPDLLNGAVERDVALLRRERGAVAMEEAARAARRTVARPAVCEAAPSREAMPSRGQWEGGSSRG